MSLSRVMESESVQKEYSPGKAIGGDWMAYVQD